MNNKLYKIIGIIAVVLLISCSEKQEQESVFKKIPYSVRYDYLDSLGKKINPNNNYQYWAYGKYGNVRTRNIILKEGGDTLFKKYVADEFEPFGFFERGHPSYRCNYVIIVENEQVRYLRTAEELRTFIGTIDNLEEALLLAETFGYQLDKDLRASQYREVENGYELHLMKFIEFPRAMERIEVQITTDGFIKTKSLGVYKRGEEVYK